MNRITLKHLEGACKNEKAIFRKLFPKGAPVTLKSAYNALECGMDIYWLIKYIPDDRREGLNKIVGAAQKVFDKTIAPAQKVCDETISPALVKALKDVK